MYATATEIPITALPKGLEKAHDGILADHGIWHIAEEHDFDWYAETPDGIAENLGVDESGSIPVLRARMKKRALTQREIDERFSRAKENYMAITAELSPKSERDAKMAEIEDVATLRELHQVEMPLFST